MSVSITTRLPQYLDTTAIGEPSQGGELLLTGTLGAADIRFCSSHVHSFDMSVVAC